MAIPVNAVATEASAETEVVIPGTLVVIDDLVLAALEAALVAVHSAASVVDPRVADLVVALPQVAADFQVAAVGST